MSIHYDVSDQCTRGDLECMRLAIELARHGEGRVSPNPPVGCVLVRDGAIVGRGWHDRLGDLHAEAAALQEAGPKAAGATAYVTLSPCTTTGRQPPCADALIRAGVSKVVIAAEDPNPKNTAGPEVLSQAGVEVVIGLLQEEAEYLARGFFKAMRRRLPFVTLKYAMTLDGKIAAASGDSRWVSGTASREVVQDMRSRHDAILVGSGTALADDPLLSVRDPVLARRGGPERHRQPLRVVADSHCRLPVGAAMFDPARGGGAVLIATAAGGVEEERIAALTTAGAEVLRLPSADGQVPLRLLMAELVNRGVNLVFCEGGGRLAAGLLRAGLVDEIVAFIAPKIIGGHLAPGPVGEMGFTRMAEARELEVRECKFVGDDIMVRAGCLDDDRT